MCIDEDESIPVVSNEEVQEIVSAITMHNLSQISSVYNGKGKLLDLILSNKARHNSKPQIATIALKGSDIHHHPVELLQHYDCVLAKTKFSSIKRVHLAVARAN